MARLLRRDMMVTLHPNPHPEAAEELDLSRHNVPKSATWKLRAVREPACSS